jgi:hypothetical protein
VKLRSKILFALVLLLVLGFIFLTPHGRYRHAVEAYKKELIAKGEKLTMSELAPPSFTNVPNGAKAFMDLMAKYQQPSDYPFPRKMIAPGLASIGCTNLAPGDMLSYERNVSNVANLRNILNMSVLDFNLDYSQSNHLVTMLFSELSYLKRGAILPAITEEQALYSKDYAEARKDLFAATDLVRLYTNEPLMISGLVRAADLQIAVAGTWEGLQSIDWTDSQLAEFQEKWQAIDFFEICESALRMERAWAVAAIAEARQTNYAGVPTSFGNAALGGSASSGNKGVLGTTWDKINVFYDRYPRFWMWKSSWSYDEELCYLQMMEVALASCRMADTTGALVPAINHFNQEASNICQLHPDGTNHFLFEDPTGQSYGRYILKLGQAETACRLTVTAIALKRYHLQHSAYPASLNELVPAFLPAVPVDFMDGKPLRYKLRPDGDFLLYSVGEDGIDDGGDPTPASQTTSLNWILGRDIVWPRVATPAALEEYHRLSQTTTNTPPRPKP